MEPSSSLEQRGYHPGKTDASCLSASVLDAGADTTLAKEAMRLLEDQARQVYCFTRACFHSASVEVATLGSENLVNYQSEVGNLHGSEPSSCTSVRLASVL